MEILHHASASYWASCPLLWGTVLAALAILVRRRRAVATVLAAGSVLVPLAFATPGAARWLDGQARAFPVASPSSTATYDAVIVLTGGTLQRLPPACEALRTGRARNLLISGRMDADEARLTMEALARSGIPLGRVVFEPDSRTTRENALRSATVVASHGWRSLLLVTEPLHMARALACFGAVGLRPVPLPAQGARDGLEHERSPGARSLLVSTFALHELIGNAACRVLSGAPW